MSVAWSRRVLHTRWYLLSKFESSDRFSVVRRRRHFEVGLHMPNTVCRSEEAGLRQPALAHNVVKWLSMPTYLS